MRAIVNHPGLSPEKEAKAGRGPLFLIFSRKNRAKLKVIAI
jgi:hypothetical protein